MCRIAIASAFLLVLVTTALAQRGCPEGAVCFEPGTVFLESEQAIDGFIFANREVLGLTGTEQFECRDLVMRDAPRTYECVQQSVQGVRGKGLQAMVTFSWGGNDVSSIRCECVRGDVTLPQVRFDTAAARSIAIRYVLARQPRIDSEDIEFAVDPELVVQARLHDDDGDSFHLAWSLELGFPSEFRSGETLLEMGIDAATGEVFFARDSTSDFRGPGFWVADMEELQQRLGPYEPWSADAFIEYQEAEASSYLGASLREFERERLESLARVQPEGTSRYLLLLPRPMDVEEVIRFIDEFALEVEAAGFYHSRISNGSTGWDFVVADFSGPASVAAESLHAAIAARSSELLEGSDSRIHDAADRQRVSEALVSDSWPGFSHLIATMNHGAALALADAETGESLVAVKAIIEHYPLVSWSQRPSY